MEEIYKKSAEIIERNLSENITMKNAYYEAIYSKKAPTKNEKQIFAIITKIQDNKKILMDVFLGFYIKKR